MLVLLASLSAWTLSAGLDNIVFGIVYGVVYGIKKGVEERYLVDIKESVWHGESSSDSFLIDIVHTTIDL